jgi:outer membrane protein assembly factor BamB
MSRRVALALLLLGLSSTSVRAQLGLPRSTIPTRTALARVGLERAWETFVPLSTTERVVAISLAGVPDKETRAIRATLLFVQTDHANLHAYDAETGRYRWGANLGRASLNAEGVSVNSDRVFATNFRTLFCLDLETGRTVWKATLDAAPSSPTAADEEHVVVGLASGKLSGFTVRDHSHDEKPGFSAATNAFNWQTRKPITGRPIPADRVVAFGSEDGRAYVAQIEPKLLLFRFLTGDAIRASIGTLGSRTLLVPSTDNNLYAVDLFDGTTRWTYPSGAPIDQEPLVAEREIYLLNNEGDLTSLNSENGQPLWSLNIRRAQILALSPTRIYGRSLDGDLAFVDRASGKILAMPRDTAERAGLNLREFSLALTNHLNDRLYFTTPSGFLISLHELGQHQPVPLRPAGGVPFGYIADEAPAETPPATPPAEAEEAPVENP